VEALADHQEEEGHNPCPAGEGTLLSVVVVVPEGPQGVGEGPLASWEGLLPWAPTSEAPAAAGYLLAP